jgi:hypothetical protein
MIENLVRHAGILEIVGDIARVRATDFALVASSVTPSA